MQETIQHFLEQWMFESPKVTTKRWLPGSPDTNGFCWTPSEMSEEDLTVGEVEERWRQEIAAKAQAAAKATSDQENKKKPKDLQAGDKPKGKKAKKETKEKTEEDEKPEDEQKEEEDTPKEEEDEPPKKKPASLTKAKAKAKGKPKPKPKSSPSKITGSPGKSSSKGSKVLKRPGSKVPVKGLKRPAAKDPKPKPEAKPKAKGGKSMLATIGQLKKGIQPKEEDKDAEEGEEEEEKENDPEVEANEEEEEKRQRGAAMKWQRMVKKGHVPPHIKELWGKCNGRKEQTQLLNRLFKKNSRTGQWEMKADNPSFLAWMKTSDTSFAKEAAQRYPRSIMIHHYFQGNEKAFQDALACGDVQEVQIEPGKYMYSFESHEVGRQKEKGEVMELKRGQVKLKAGEHDVVSSHMLKWNWKDFGQGSPETKQNHIKPLALTNGPVVLKWSDVEESLQEAKGAHDRVLGMLNKLFQPVGNSKDPDLVGKFKETVTKLQQNSQSISNAMMFKDCCEWNCMFF